MYTYRKVNVLSYHNASTETDSTLLFKVSIGRRNHPFGLMYKINVQDAVYIFAEALKCVV